ncbi:MAG: glycosyltransferase [Sideroxyarcus sp.]
MVRISLVFGFKNRDGLRVRRCLESLAKQEFDQFEVIFVDYGSETECRKEIEPIVKGYSFAKYIYCEMRGRPWNRAHALNIGIRLAQAEFVMMTDIDLIFSEFSLAKLVDGYDGRTALHPGCYYLPRKFDHWDNLYASRSKCEKSVPHALGLLLIPKEVLVRLGGYDEFYKFWGREDADLEQRLNRIGFETKFLDLDEYPLYHQWHPIQNSTTSSFMPSGYWTQALFHFGEYANIENRNEQEKMGRLLEISERPALLYLDGKIKASLSLHEDPWLALELAKSFCSLKEGEAMEIHSHWIGPSAFWEKFAIRLNEALHKKDIGFFIDYKKNMAKQVFWNFIDSYPDLIKDFAYTADEQKFYLVRK